MKRFSLMIFILFSSFSAHARHVESTLSAQKVPIDDFFENTPDLHPADQLYLIEMHIVYNDFSAQDAHRPLNLWYFRARYFSDEMGRFISRDPLGYVDGFGLYGGYFAERFALDPSGLSAEGDDYGCCGGSSIDTETQCCENDQIVDKISVFVINRDIEGKSLVAGHIDLVIPGLGLIGFFGTPDQHSAQGDEIGQNWQGWLYHNHRAWEKHRPDYVKDHLSLICELKVCPTDAKKMKEKALKIKFNPPRFKIFEGNCATRGCSILGAGNSFPDQIPGIDSPVILIDMVKKRGGKCFLGYSRININSGKVDAALVERQESGRNVVRYKFNHPR